MSRAITVVTSEKTRTLRSLLERIAAISVKLTHPNPIALGITTPENDK